MPANVSLNYSGVYDASSSPIAIGDVLCQNASGTGYVVATDAAVAASFAKASEGIALDPSASSPGSVRIQRSDTISPGICFGPNTNPGPVRRNSLGRLERANLDSTSDWYGSLYADGSVNINRLVTLGANVPNTAAPFFTFAPSGFGCPCDGIRDDGPGWAAMTAAISSVGADTGARVDLPLGRMYFANGLHITRPLYIVARSPGTAGSTILEMAPGTNLFIDGPTVSPDGGDAGNTIIENVEIYSTQIIRGDPTHRFMGAARAASTFYELGRCVVRTAANTSCYFQCTTAGTTGSGGDPAGFSATTPGTTVTDGSVTWTAKAYIKDYNTAATAYVVGQRVMVIGEQRYYFECTVSGTTAGGTPAAFASPQINQVITDGTVTWLAKQHTVQIQTRATFQQCNVHGFTNAAATVQTGAAMVYPAINTNGDFNRFYKLDIQDCGCGIWFRGFDSQAGTIDDVTAIYLGQAGFDSGSGRTIKDAIVGSGTFGFRDNSSNGNRFSSCYVQVTEGPGFWLDTTGGASVAVGCGSETLYGSVIGNSAIYIGSSIAGYQGVGGGQPSGFIIDPGGCRNIYSADATVGSPLVTLRAWLSRNNGQTWYQEFAANEAAPSGMCPSDKLTGGSWPVGWHVWAYNATNSQSSFAVAGPNAKWPSGATVTDFAFWAQDRVLIGPFTADAPSIDFGTSFPVTGRWVAGSIRYNIAPAGGQPEGWRCTVTGNTGGTWTAMGNHP